MAKTAIYAKGLKGTEIEALKNLLEGAGGSTVAVQVLQAIGDADDDDEVILMLGTPAVCADARLEANLVKAHANGQRVIWVWPEGGEDMQPPPAVRNYCYSRIPWVAQKLRAVLADDDVICFETATGKPDPNPDTERLCVEEKPNVK